MITITISGPMNSDKSRIAGMIANFLIENNLTTDTIHMEGVIRKVDDGEATISPKQFQIIELTEPS